MQNLFNTHKTALFEMLQSESFEQSFMDFIKILKQDGYTKHQIYRLFLCFHEEIQSDERTKNNKKLYNRLSDFMDGFTGWGKVTRILPDEPDV